MNPITGKRLNRSLLVDRELEDAFTVYPSIERFLGASFFRRLLHSAKAVVFCEGYKLSGNSFFK